MVRLKEIHHAYTFLLTEHWKQRCCWFFLGAVALLFLFTALRIPKIWYADFKLTKGYSNVVPEVMIPKEQRTDLIEQIPNWHIFGNPAKVDDSSTLPITSLQLRLIGVVRAIPSRFSSVLISEAGQAGKVYLVGDILPVGVKINAITEDGVILDNAGRLEKLPLQRQPLSFQGMPKKLLREE